MPHGTRTRWRAPGVAVAAILALFGALLVSAPPANASTVVSIASVQPDNLTYTTYEGSTADLHCDLTTSDGAGGWVQVQYKEYGEPWSSAVNTDSVQVTADGQVTWSPSRIDSNDLSMAPNSHYIMQCRASTSGPTGPWTYSPTKKSWYNATNTDGAVSVVDLWPVWAYSPSSVGDTTATVTCAYNPLSDDATGVYGYYKKHTDSTWTAAGNFGGTGYNFTQDDASQSFTITGLTPGTLYDTKCTGGGYNWPQPGAPYQGADSPTLSFTTTQSGPVSPSVESVATDGITDTAATLHCTADPGNDTATVNAQYKLSADPWSSATTTSSQTVSGAAGQAVSFPITGLTPGASYIMQCRIKNSVTGSTYVLSPTKKSWAQNSSSNTQPPVPHSVDTSNITATTSTLNCSVDPGNQTVEVWANWKTQADSWSNAVNTAHQTVSGPTGTLQYASWDVTGLSASTGYIMQCVTKVVPGGSNIYSAGKKSWTTAASNGTDKTIALAGDICDESADGGVSSCSGTGDLVRFYNPDAVITLGDMQYLNATQTEIDTIYDDPAAWGSFSAKTYPTIGNHEERSGNADAWCNYWAGVGTYTCPTGSSARVANNGNYATDLGKWTVIHLDSTGTAGNAAAGATSVLNARLADFQSMLDTANAQGDNVIVTFHHPRWASACNGCHGDNPETSVFWDKAIANGVDLMFAGHDHVYERFDRMTGSGVAATGEVGIPEFVVGTGGATEDVTGTTRDSGSLYRLGNVKGILLLTLHDTSASFQFVKADGNAGGSVLDQGTLNVNP